MLRRIADELKNHAPFTALGAITGIIIIVIIAFSNVLPQVSQISYTVFYILHPTHVALSALVTTAMYKKYSNSRIWAAILIGYLGSISIATLSDSIIPYLGETLLGLENRGIHIGVIEEPLLTIPAAFVGIAIAYWKPTTKFPHYGHVLISTWASLFHIIMALGETVNWITFLAIFLFLFLAVWLPCCTSDIVFPLLFIRKKLPPQPT
ncbi:MAG: hypothetical protein E3J75_03270 [Dehalococcoidia bacterium]|nr:MAG: hypothetical protein E3J75_03270 [Dehalococcoidia bacterium]